jgi:hypothetical protein
MTELARISAAVQEVKVQQLYPMKLPTLFTLVPYPSALATIFWRVLKEPVRSQNCKSERVLLLWQMHSLETNELGKWDVRVSVQHSS